MPRPELQQVKRRYAELVTQLDALEAADVCVAASQGPEQAKCKQDIIDELGKIEHWLWILEPD